MVKKKIVKQVHHLSYEPDVHGTLFKGEHWLLTQIGRRKNISKWFIQCLDIWLILNRAKAKEIE